MGQTARNVRRKAEKHRGDGRRTDYAYPLRRDDSANDWNAESDRKNDRKNEIIGAAPASNVKQTKNTVVKAVLKQNAEIFYPKELYLN